MREESLTTVAEVGTQELDETAGCKKKRFVTTKEENSRQKVSLEFIEASESHVVFVFVPYFWRWNSALRVTNLPCIFSSISYHKNKRVLSNEDAERQGNVRLTCPLISSTFLSFSRFRAAQQTINEGGKV